MGSLSLSSMVHVVPILIVGAFGVAIAIERGYTLFVRYSMRGSKSFYENLRELVLTDKMSEALGLVSQYKHKPVGAVVEQAIMRINQPEELIEQGLGIAVSHEISRVQRRTSYLATVANVSTLLGLFGTILGLVRSFEALGGVGAQQRSTLLTQGISTAMNATLLGLGVAIPCMIIYSILASRTNKHIAEIEEASLRSMDIIKERLYGVDELRNRRKVG